MEASILVPLLLCPHPQGPSLRMMPDILEQETQQSERTDAQCTRVSGSPSRPSVAGAEVKNSFMNFFPGSFSVYA